RTDRLTKSGILLEPASMAIQEELGLAVARLEAQRSARSPVVFVVHPFREPVRDRRDRAGREERSRGFTFAALLHTGGMDPALAVRGTCNALIQRSRIAASIVLPGLRVAQPECEARREQVRHDRHLDRALVVLHESPARPLVAVGIPPPDARA